MLTTILHQLSWRIFLLDLAVIFSYYVSICLTLSFALRKLVLSYVFLPQLNIVFSILLKHVTGGW
uniref:Uncharacterized protein n=1 Tax=Arundo donax TaxID=35708 RepID=A0A0A8YMR1_ARUDO